MQTLDQASKDQKVWLAGIRRVIVGVVLLAATGMLLGKNAFASSALIRHVGSAASGPVLVQTFGGVGKVSSSVIHPATALVVVWAVDSFDLALLARAKQDLVSILDLGRSRSVRLAVLSGDTLTFTAIASRADAERISNSIALPADQAKSAEWLDALRSNTQKLGSDWSPVLLEGRLPHDNESGVGFAQSLLQHTFASHRLRVFHVGAENDRWRRVFESTGGVEAALIDGIAPAMDEPSQGFQEVSWTTGVLPAGFIVLDAELQDVRSQISTKIPDLVSGNQELPTIEEEAVFEQHVAQVVTLLNAPSSDESARQERALLAEGQSFNSLDPHLLRAEALYCEQGKALDEALKAAVLLTQVRPKDPEAWATLGHAQVLAGDLREATTALDRATLLKASPVNLAADYARIHLAENDPEGALHLLQEAIGASTNDDLAKEAGASQTMQELRMLQGNAAEGVSNHALAIQAYEAALQLHEPSGRAAASLIRLYLAEHDTAKAESLVAKALAILPADFKVRLAFAEQLESAKLGEKSKLAWMSLLALKPPDADTCVRAAQSMLAAGNSEAAAEMAQVGVHHFPQSSPLYLVWTDALLQQTRSYEARSTLESGATATGDPVLLRRLAKVEEGYADRAEEVYEKLAATYPSGSPEQKKALEQGRSIATRDGELDAAAKFAGQLQGDASNAVELPASVDPRSMQSNLIPGGLEGLALVAHMSSGVTPDRFYTEYAKTLITHVCRTNCAETPFAEDIVSYFKNVLKLEAMGKREQNRVTITLGWSSDGQRRSTSAALAVFGLEVRDGHGKPKVGRSRSAPGSENLQAALGFDQIGLEQALQDGKPYTFEIVDQSAKIAGGQTRWSESFKQPYGNFALLLLEAPEAARLYAGLSRLDDAVLEVLLQKSSLRDLADGSSDALAMYGTCLALENGRAMVPGGVSAYPIWQSFLGVSPEDPAAFFAALLQPRNLDLLAYYSDLSQLDPEHQTFFTSSLTRASEFEKRFAAMQEQQGSHRALTSNSVIADLLRDLPLDQQGRVLFPGSARIWRNLRVGQAEWNLLRSQMGADGSRTTAEGTQDAILLRLSEQRLAGRQSAAADHDSAHGRDSELAAFLAVEQVDSHRVTPLDEDSALLLAQRYSEFAPLYPYFMEIRTIDVSAFQAFFNLLDRLRKLPVMERNLALGQLEGLIEWDAILSRRHQVTDEQAARLFSGICEKMMGDSAGSRVQSSVALMQELLRSCSDSPAATSLDHAIRACFQGESSGSSDDPEIEDSYQTTMNALNAPRLRQVEQIVDDLNAMLASREGRKQLPELKKLIHALPTVPVPNQISSIGYQRESLMIYDTADLRKLVDNLSNKAGADENDVTQLRKVATTMLNSLEPQVTLALAAPVYAHFLRSTDLVVSEDPLLLRKHRYFDFGSMAGQNELVVQSEFVFNTDGAGSYLRGSFAEFGLAAAQAASAGMRQGGKGGKAVIADQIAAIRGAEWDLLTERDLRVASLRILAAREWIVAAQSQPAQRKALSDATIGLLSFARRARLLHGIDAQDWQEVWASVTLPDLFTLGGSKLLPHDLSNRSQVFSELEKLESKHEDGSLDVLARLPFQTEGCYHPHTVKDAPYEEYEGRADMDDLAERSAEFKLYLAYHADSLGLTPTQTGAIAERLALKALRTSQMNDYHDWRSLLAAYASIGNKDLTEALAPVN